LKGAPFAAQPSLDPLKVKDFRPDWRQIQASTAPGCAFFAHSDRKSGAFLLALCPQQISLHHPAVEMEKRHVGVVAQGARGEAPVEFAKHVPGHRVQVGERL